MDLLSELARSPIFLLKEFFDSIEPLALVVGRMAGDDQRHDFYVRLLPHLIAYCRELGLTHPHETALFVVDLIKKGSATAHTVCHLSTV
jgi:hypothetical protein